MKGLLLEAKWDPRPSYALSDFEKRTGKAVEGFNVWRNPRLGITEVPDPRAGPGEALIRIHACGVCGSDMHFYETDADNYILYPGLTKFPAILGHEFSGEIVELGPGPESEGFKVGDRVTVMQGRRGGQGLRVRGVGRATEACGDRRRRSRVRPAGGQSVRGHPGSDEGRGNRSVS